MPKRGQLRLSFVIAWLIITNIITVSCSNEDADLKNWPPNIREMVERNRRTIGDLFDVKKSKENTVDKTRIMPAVICDDSNLSRSRRRGRKLSGKSLTQLSGPDILEDPDNSEGYNTPHVRVKRISNLLDSPYQKNLTLPNQKSRFFNVNQRRVSRRMFKRFAPDDSIPADESEAEYSNGLGDNDDVELDIDIPGGSLNDEISNKRNSFEDVYPEVKNVDNRKVRVPNAELQRNSKVVSRDVRRKRVGDDRGSNPCVYDEQNADFYYDGDDRIDKAKVKTRNDLANTRIASQENVKVNQKNIRQAQASKKSKVKSKKVHKTPSVKKSKPAKKGKLKTKKKPAKKKPKSIPKKKAPKVKPKKSAVKESINYVAPKTGVREKSVKIDSSKTAAAQPSKSDVREQANNAELNECVDEETEDMDRAKRNKEIISSNVPLNRERKAQIDQKARCCKQNDMNEYQLRSRSGQSIGELRDLLGKLIVKIEDLRDIVSEMKVSRNE